MKDASDRNVSIVDLENNMDNESGDKTNVELRKKISFKGLMKRFTESKSKNQVNNSSTHSGAGSDTVPNAEQNESYAVHNKKDESYCSVGSRENRNVSNHALPTSPTSVAGILGDTKEINCETQEKSSLVDVNIENLAVSNAFSGILDDDTKEIKCETQEKSFLVDIILCDTKELKNETQEKASLLDVNTKNLTQEKASLVDVNIENLTVSNAFSAIETIKKSESGECSVYDKASWGSRNTRAQNQLGRLGASSRGRSPRMRDSVTNNEECSISSSHVITSKEKEMCGPLSIVGAIKTEKKPHSGRCSDVETQSVSSSYVSAPRSQLRQLTDRLMCNNAGNVLQAHSTFESYYTFDEEGTIPEDRSFLTGVLNKSEPMMDVLNLLTCGPANDPMEEFMEDSRIASFSDSPTFTLSNSASGDSFWDSVKKPISRSSSK